MKKVETQERIGPKLKFILNSFRRIANKSTADLGITGTQSIILNYLARNAEVRPCQHDLEVKFNIKHPTATGILKRMADRGFVEFTQDQYDKRLKRIVITEKGMAATEQIKLKLDRLESFITNDFTEDELSTLHVLLDKMIANAKSQRDAVEALLGEGDGNRC